MSPEPIDPPIEPKGDEEEIHAREPLAVAWFQVYGADMPGHLIEPLAALALECSVAAVIHGIKESHSAESYNFRYIAACARNYVPISKLAGFAKGPSYQVDLPGVHTMAPRPGPAPALPPPLATDDPWATALAELASVLPGTAATWLAGSTLKANGELAGVPLYRVVLVAPGANVEWLRQQAEPAIRKKLSGLLRQRLILDFAILDRVAA